MRLRALLFDGGCVESEIHNGDTDSGVQFIIENAPEGTFRPLDVVTGSGKAVIQGQNFKHGISPSPIYRAGRNDT